MDTIVFIVGAALFALTVYGAVMGAGIRLTLRQIDESGPLQDGVADDDELDKALPTNLKY